MSLTKARSYLRKTRDPVANLLLVLPLVLVYGAGVVFLDSRAFNGADFITERLYAQMGAQWLGLTYGAVALGFAIALSRMNRSGAFDTGIYGLILAESLLYAILLGETTARILSHLGLGPSDPVFQLPVLTRVLVSIGAGVNEELLFRLLLIGGLMPVLTWLLRGHRGTALVTLVIVSSFLFAAAHLVAEPFSLDRFVFRFVSGVLFALLYRTRGFAVAVYTHALYDIRVLVLH
jgi:membrane protease YdiL (CAAX protease family)